jgi:hypothetical protein
MFVGAPLIPAEITGQRLPHSRARGSIIFRCLDSRVSIPLTVWYRSCLFVRVITVQTEPTDPLQRSLVTVMFVTTKKQKQTGKKPAHMKCDDDLFGTSSFCVVILRHLLSHLGISIHRQCASRTRAMDGSFLALFILTVGESVGAILKRPFAFPRVTWHSNAFGV